MVPWWSVDILYVDRPLEYNVLSVHHDLFGYTTRLTAVWWHVPPLLGCHFWLLLLCWSSVVHSISVELWSMQVEFSPVVWTWISFLAGRVKPCNHGKGSYQRWVDELQSSAPKGITACLCFCPCCLSLHLFCWRQCSHVTVTCHSTSWQWSRAHRLPEMLNKGL